MGGKLKIAAAYDMPKKLLSEADYLLLERAIGRPLQATTREDIQRIFHEYMYWAFLLHASDAAPIQRYFSKAAKLLEKAELLIAAGPVTDDPHADNHVRTICSSARCVPDDPLLNDTLARVRGARVNFARALKDLNEKWVEPPKRGPVRDEGFNGFVANFAECLDGAGITPTLSWHDAEPAGFYASPFLDFVSAAVRLLPEDMQSRETTLETHVKAGLALWKTRPARA